MSQAISSAPHHCRTRYYSTKDMQVHQLNEAGRGGRQIIRATAKFLVKQYVSNNWIRYCYVLAKGISTKIVIPVLPILHELVFEKLKLYLRKQYLHRDRSWRNPVSESIYQVITSIPANFNPKVTVIVPSYNDAGSLRERLNSIYQQTFSNFEVILLDDGSTDKSRDILEEYCHRYPRITRCSFEEESVTTTQWARGIQLARGDLVWIAETGDYCSTTLLAELVKYFANEAVMLAYCKNELVDGRFDEPVNSSTEYPHEVNFELGPDQFVMSAHKLVNKAWSIKSNVPKISSTIFRHPGKLELLNNKNWRRMKIFGDWIFYLHLIRGGLVAFSPQVTNYSRLHQHNASQGASSTRCLYEEQEQVAKALITLYKLETQVVIRQTRTLKSSWRTFHMDCSEDSFIRRYDDEWIQKAVLERKPNLLMASFALTAGGGETFPIQLANLLKIAGYGITFLNCHKAPTEVGVRRMLLPTIPLLELDTLSKLATVIDDMGIELVHSHHSWVDVCVSYFLEDHSDVQLVVTSHGIYEMTPPAVLAQIFPLLRKRVNKFVYLTDKNLPVFKSHQFDTDCFVKIGNALDIIPVTPVSRETFGVSEEAFLICLVSRAIPEKGWEEAIETVKLAREISQRDIHLLLIGAGPEYERLKPLTEDKFVHFLGFRANVRDYFAASDLGFLPSRYPAESFPLVLIECLHSNRPILASNLGEIENMLSTSKGRAGTVFDLNNWNIPITEVARLIVEYVENTELYRNHLYQVPEAVSKFNPLTLREKYEAVYLELIKEG
ncbi:glycosyltransferase involved in cell wall biosynthesis [Nitrosospira sp. Nsp2]|uniref:glycosyltransferase n=1 Tax=Nitrosospira sp. Nsp2 TaxID=136548 RepID=UPI000D2FFB6F|nr:glycosyltransferase [Nitrosospira sp. Nsp2]PTR16270.1 glycosyltransferase involved in cell wall biosynthesis [Nitrosospira sp. Nsp2]